MTKITIQIDLGDQRLDLVEGDSVVCSYPISSARNGAGEQDGSECTPRGTHEIVQKIGSGCESGSVFVGRETTGEVCTPAHFDTHPDRDWILTRVLWLAGLEPGRNLGGDVDTQHRMIYIHGCPQALELGVPGSHGCIRMANTDVIDLFDRVDVGTRVQIDE